MGNSKLTYVNWQFKTNILKLNQANSEKSADNLRLATINFKTSTDTDFKLAYTNSQRSTDNLELTNIPS